MSIKNILFDVGNVLVDFDWDGYIHKLFDDENLIQELNVAVWGDGRWDRFDMGDDTEAVIQSMVDADPKHEKEIRSIFPRVGETIRKRDYSHDWIKSLKAKGYKVYYLSNYSHLVMNANPDALDFVPLMDGGVFSCYIHMIKPSREIYEYIANKYNLVPSECVFIDDLERNIEAAKNFGFHGIQFITHEQVLRDLNNLLEADK
ncbi:MAG: HAD family phosphatase [Synergistaceae bacterium]|nr:HAD family phosphatase [Synergistaceae bacterium]